MKIVVIGYAGSGKSTISKSISQAYDVPLLYLDCVHFLPNWEKRKLEEEIEIVENFFNENDNWIIDGNYFNVLFEERLEKADKIVLFNFGRLSCLYRAYKRSIEYRGKPRESINPECDEIMDFDFIKHILFDRKKEKEVYDRVAKTYVDKISIISNQKELDSLYNELGVKHENTSNC